MVIFYDVTRRLLQQRLNTVQTGGVPTWTDLRHFFYECRLVFLRENPTLSEPDSKAQNLYADWEKVIKNWCIGAAESLEIEKDLYWRVRESLNIWPEGKSVCEGEAGSFLVTKQNRAKVGEKCSFILLCEKKTVSNELLERLQRLGYKVNLVATGGFSPSDVQEAVLQITDTLPEEADFYILMLHDYDLAGVQIYFNLAKRYSSIIDVGVNKQFIEFLKSNVGFDERLIVEKVKNKNFQQKFKEAIERDEQGYTLEDFDWLMGEKVGERNWQGKRIEIDAVHVEHGIEPFVEYIQEQIQEHCKCWDLTRIGIGDYELIEPSNPYKEAIDSFEHEVSEAYGLKQLELNRNRRLIDAKIFNALFNEELRQLKHTFLNGQKSEYGQKWVISIRDGEGKLWTVPYYSVTGIPDLKANWETMLNTEWKDDFEGDLAELNELVHHYCGDVRYALEDLNEKHYTIQHNLNEAADTEIGFDEELEEIEWGKEQLEKIQPRSLEEDVKLAIKALQEWLKEIQT